MAGIVMFGKNSNTGPSPGLWGLAPRDVWYDPAVAYGFVQDFMGLDALGTTEAVIAGSDGWIGFGDTGATAVSGPQTDEVGGAYSVASDGDNESAAISTLTRPFQITKLAEEFFFECRIKASTIANTTFGVFVGMMDGTTLVNDIPIIDTGVMADINYVGFHRLEGDGDTFDTVYKADGVTAVTVKADAVTAVAATYLKLGMHLKNGVLTFFKNGVELADTKSIPDATGTDFPADVQLKPVIAVMNAVGSSPGDVTASFLIAKQLRSQ